MLLVEAKVTAFTSFEQALIFQTAIAYPQRYTDSCYGMWYPDPNLLNIHGNTFIYKEDSRASYWNFLLACLQFNLWNTTEYLGVLGNFIKYLPIGRWLPLCKVESRNVLDPSSYCFLWLSCSCPQVIRGVIVRASFVAGGPATKHCKFLEQQSIDYFL